MLNIDGCDLYAEDDTQINTNNINTVKQELKTKDKEKIKNEISGDGSFRVFRKEEKKGESKKYYRIDSYDHYLKELESNIDYLQNGGFYKIGRTL